MPGGSTHTLIEFVRRLGQQAEPAETTDSQLLERFAHQQDEAAFAVLLERHGPMVYGVCRRLLRRPEDIEDAFQATFLVLVRKAGSLRQGNLLANWLYGVASRTAAKARSLTARRWSRESELLDADVSDPRSEPAWDDAGNVLDEEVNRLPVRYRAAFVLHYLEGKTTEEAARQLGCAKGTIQSRLASARERLRVRLTRRGLVLPAGLFAGWLSERTAPAAVPAALFDRGLRSSLLFAAGEAAAGSASAHAVTLTKGVLQAMFFKKMKLTFFVVLAILLCGAGAGLWSRPAPAMLIMDDASESSQRPNKKEADAKKKDDPRRAIEIVKKSFQTSNRPTLMVELFNGNIDVVIGDQGAVNAEVRKESHAETPEAAREALKQIKVTMEKEDNMVRITASQPERHPEHTNFGASAKLQVPAGAVLHLATSNGSLSLQGGTGAADLRTSNGSITVHDHKGEQHLTTTNGSVVVAGSTGTLRIKSSNGPLTIQADKAAVTARTSNSPIRFDGTLADGEHTFTTSNGNVVVTLPPGTRLRCEASLSNGHVRNAFPRVESDEKPGIRLKLSTSNGNIDVREAK